MRYGTYHYRSSPPFLQTYRGGGFVGDTFGIGDNGGFISIWSVLQSPVTGNVTSPPESTSVSEARQEKQSNSRTEFADTLRKLEGKRQQTVDLLTDKAQQSDSSRALLIQPRFTTLVPALSDTSWAILQRELEAVEDKLRVQFGVEPARRAPLADKAAAPAPVAMMESEIWTNWQKVLGQLEQQLEPWQQKNAPAFSTQGGSGSAADTESATWQDFGEQLLNLERQRVESLDLFLQKVDPALR